jgi:Xaa-Pro aminopeptidase
VKFDGGVNAGYHYYTTDMARTYVMPTAETQRGADADYALKRRIKSVLFDALRRAEEVLGPGVKTRDVFYAGFEQVRESFGWYERGHIGHSMSIGPFTTEPPMLAPHDETVVEPGMLFAVELPCYIRGFAGFNLEDIVLVTDDGIEILTDTPHWMPWEERNG